MAKPTRKSGSTAALKKGKPADAATKVTIGLAAALVLALVALAVWFARREPARPPSPATEVAAPRSAVSEAKPPAPPPRPAPKASEPAPEPAPELEPEPPAPEFATAWARGKTEMVTVKRVVDGDTVELGDGRKVRLIGINTPEKDEPLYADAAAALRELVDGAQVTLELDQEKVDQYKRTLGYLFKGELFVNGEVVRRGLAYCFTWEPNTAHRDELLGFQKQARGAKRGLWGRPLPAPESRYVAAGGHRFHRPACRRVERARGQREEFGSRDEALDAGNTPCNECKP